MFVNIELCKMFFHLLIQMFFSLVFTVCHKSNVLLISLNRNILNYEEYFSHFSILRFNIIAWLGDTLQKCWSYHLSFSYKFSHHISALSSLHSGVVSLPLSQGFAPDSAAADKKFMQ